MRRKEPTERTPIHWAVWLILGLILLGAFLLRWRLRECPLERDEGEYAYIGRLILEGVAPYGIAANHKFPGPYLAYAAIMAVFGQTIAGIHLGMLVVNLANTCLIFFLGRRLSGNVVGLAAAAAWALMSVSSGVFGNAGHLTHFVVLAVLSGVLLLGRWIATQSAGSLVAAGFCLGASIVFRQTSLVFVALGVALIWLGTEQGRVKPIATLVASSAIPLAVMGVWLWLAGVFPQFWRWTFTEAATYGSQWSLREGAQKFLTTTPLVISWYCLIWIGAAIGFVLVLRERSRGAWLLIGLLLGSVIALTPGLYFREHYYVQILPAIALLFGTAVEKGFGLLPPWRQLSIIGAAGALVLPLMGQHSYFLETSPTALARSIYGGNPFPEAIEIANYIKTNSGATDPIAVLGSEPEIFFYAQRRSATSLIYTYPLMEHHQYAHGLQETMAREIEEKAPKFIVFVGAPTSWLTRQDSDRFILNWADDYLSRHYRLDGVADILAEGPRYVWGAEAPSYQAQSNSFINVYRRISD